MTIIESISSIGNLKSISKTDLSIFSNNEASESLQSNNSITLEVDVSIGAGGKGAGKGGKGRGAGKGRAGGD